MHHHQLLPGLHVRGYVGGYRLEVDAIRATDFYYYHFVLRQS
jgi:hypothetical protein